MSSSDICELYEVGEIPELVRGETVLVHAPDGLKPLYKCVQPLLRKLETSAYFSSSPGYGACDIPFEEAEAIGAKAIIHLGHLSYPLAPKPREGISVIYVPVYFRGQIGDEVFSRLESILRGKGASRVTLSSTLIEQRIRDIISNRLRASGFSVVDLGQPVLGCYYSHVTALDKEVDAHVIIAGGSFHALGLAISAAKPTIAVDPYRGEVIDMSEEALRTLKRRMFKIFLAKSSGGRRLGIVAGSRLGQARDWLNEMLAEKAEENGYEVYMISSTYVNLERLIAIDNALSLDVYVVTSCPRLPIDDLEDFYKPVLTPGEFLMLTEAIDRYVYPW